MTEPLRPTQIMTEHYGRHLCGGWVWEEEWPCETYRLAEALTDARAVITGGLELLAVDGETDLHRAIETRASEDRETRAALADEQSRFDNLVEESSRWTRENAEHYLAVVAEREAHAREVTALVEEGIRQKRRANDALARVQRVEVVQAQLAATPHHRHAAAFNGCVAYCDPCVAITLGDALAGSTEETTT